MADKDDSGLAERQGWAAWNDQVVPELERMKQEFLPAGRGTSASRWSRWLSDTTAVHGAVRSHLQGRWHFL
jgi:hypothetical protein